MPPPNGNLLQRAARADRAVVSIGKVGDIFAHRDTGDERKGKSNDGNVDLLIDALATAPEGGLILVNLVDFDTEWGHRRDVSGYAACLEAFDRRLGAIEAAMRPADYCVITADHGNDPTFRGFAGGLAVVRVTTGRAVGDVRAGGPGRGRAALAGVARLTGQRPVHGGRGQLLTGRPRCPGRGATRPASCPRSRRRPRAARRRRAGEDAHVHLPRVADAALRAGKERAKNPAAGVGNGSPDTGSTCGKGAVPLPSLVWHSCFSWKTTPPSAVP